MEILSQQIKDLLREYPRQVREALDRLRRDETCAQVTFVGNDDQPITIRRVHLK
jgi:hypothetical protein